MPNLNIQDISLVPLVTRQGSIQNDLELTNVCFKITVDSNALNCWLDCLSVVGHFHSRHRQATIASLFFNQLEMNYDLRLTNLINNINRSLISWVIHKGTCKNTYFACIDDLDPEDMLTPRLRIISVPNIKLDWILAYFKCSWQHKNLAVLVTCMN